MLRERSRLDTPSEVIWQVNGPGYPGFPPAGGRKGGYPDDERALTTGQGEELIDQVADCGRPFPGLVLTGEPFRRTDLFELVTHARSLSLAPAVRTVGGPHVTTERLALLRSCGAHTLALSLEGGTAASHDAVWQRAGSFEQTLRACRAAHDLGLRLQIDTTVRADSLAELGRIYLLVAERGIKSWNLSFPATFEPEAITPEQCEVILHFLARVGQRLGVKTNEGHHYRRVLTMRMACWASAVSPEQAITVGGVRLGAHPLYCALTAYLPPDLPRGRRAGARPLPNQPVSAPVFIGPAGEVRPSPLLKLSVGNLRERRLIEIYRSSPLFGPLREPSQLLGRCGRCEFKAMCGGSWARSLAQSGTPLGEDPLCAYEPGSFPYRLQPELKSAEAL